MSTAVKTPELQTVVIRFQHQQASKATRPKQRGWGGSCLSHSPCSGLLRLQKKMMRLSHSAGFLNDPKAHKHGSRLPSHLHQCKSFALKSRLCPERRFKCLDGASGLFKQNHFSVEASVQDGAGLRAALAVLPCPGNAGVPGFLVRIQPTSHPAWTWQVERITDIHRDHL